MKGAIITAKKNTTTANRADVLQELEQRTVKAIQTLKEVSEHGEKDSDRVSASKALLEIGLKYRDYYEEQAKQEQDDFLNFNIPSIDFTAGD